MQKQIAILTEKDKQAWYQELNEVVINLDAQLKIMNTSTLKIVDWNDFDLILLDLVYITDSDEVIGYLRKQYPNIFIIAFSPSPRWKQARKMLYAGVTDYLNRSNDKDYLFRELNSILINKD